MRIALVTHTVKKNDGQGRVNYETAKFAGRNGYRVTLVAAEAAPELLAMPGIDWAYIPEGRLPTRLLSYQQFATRTAAWLKKYRNDFDLVHVNGFITYAPSDVNVAHFVHSGWRKSPSYMVQNGVRGGYHFLFTLFNSRLEWRAFSQARRIVAVSQKIADELTEIGIAQQKIRVITNGVDTEQFQPGAADRRLLGLPENVMLALFAGDIRDYRKNLDTVLRALPLVPGVHLAVAGRVGGSPFPELARKLGLSDRVTFLDFRADMADLMRASDVFMFPSRYEACSLVLLEALSSGLPIIAAKTVGGCEIMADDCGLVLDDPNDAVAVADALRRLQNSPAVLDRMRQCARETALRNTWEIMSAQYLTLYEELAAHKRPAFAM